MLVSPVVIVGKKMYDRLNYDRVRKTDSPNPGRKIKPHPGLELGMEMAMPRKPLGPPKRESKITSQ
jgi:hypothetical protein